MSPFSKAINRDILTVIEICSCADKSILNVTIHPNKSYFSRNLSDLLKQNIITYRNDQKKTLRFTKAGLDALKAYDPQAFDYYMQHSYGNHLPSDEKYRTSNRRQVGVVACMLKAGFDVGTAKPSAEDIWEGAASKMPPTRCTYYMAKELRYVQEQIRSRNHLSRASGMLFCPGMKALVYNALNQDMEITRKLERQTMISLSHIQNELYSEGDYDYPDYALVFIQDDATAVKLMRQKPAAAKGGKRRKAKIALTEAIRDPEILGTHFLYIPTNQTGITELKLLRTFTEEQLLNLLFKPEEQAAAAAQGYGDAIFCGIPMFNFLTPDLTRMVWVREHLDPRTVGFVCMKEQKKLLIDFFGTSDLRGFVFKQEEVDLLLKGINPHRSLR